MQVQFVGRLVIVLLLAVAMGCQTAPGLTRAGNVPAGALAADGAQPLQAAGATSSVPSPAILHTVSYNAAASPAPAEGTAATGIASATPLADDREERESFLRDLVASRQPTFHIQEAVTRGQTPVRSVFLSDRAIIFGIVAAAIVIPFAVHDSRQPNPPMQ
jgi:hypothetical protein